MTTIRLLLSIVVSLQWHVHYLDINTALLHGDLDEEIYMKCPPGLTTAKNLVCKLTKSVYGLKQAKR